MQTSDRHTAVGDSSPRSNSADWLRVNESNRLSTGIEVELPEFNKTIVPLMNLWTMLALFLPLK